MDFFSNGFSCTALWYPIAVTTFPSEVLCYQTMLEFDGRLFVWSWKSRKYSEGLHSSKTRFIEDILLGLVAG